MSSSPCGWAAEPRRGEMHTHTSQGFGRSLRRTAASARGGLPLLIAAMLALGIAGPAFGQRSESEQQELERLVDRGAHDVLAARLRGSKRPEDVHMIARAAANYAARQRAPDARHKAFAAAAGHYEAWIATLEREPGDEPETKIVATAAARLELGNMLLSRWATADLDELELSDGRRGDRQRLAEILTRARQALERGWTEIQPLASELDRGGIDVEDRYLSLGLFDTLHSLETDLQFNLAWANYYIAVVESRNEARRSESLRAAERYFQNLIEAVPTGASAYRVFLGMGMTLREQGRLDEAQRYFDTAMQDADFVAEARIRYERARAHLAANRFEEARAVLAPLVDLRERDLTPEQQPARFFVNLAHLWDANSYLTEAEALRREAETSSSKAAVLLRARRARELGLIRLNRLASRGGPWAGLVRLYVADSIRLDASLSELSPVELLLTARELTLSERHAEAIARLEEAARRDDLSADLAGEIQYELAVARYRAGQIRAAATAFEQLAFGGESGRKSAFERADDAATYAYQLRAQAAEESRAAADYGQLADTLLKVLQYFPQHPQRSQIVWWLPVALQAAGRYTEAVEQFGKVPRESAYWEQAQLRRALCLRRALEQDRPRLAAPEFSQRAQQVAGDLLRYARDAQARIGSSPDPAAVRSSAAEATVNAAELLVEPGVDDFERALSQLDQFETRYPESDAVGRVLAARIRALRGLRRFDEATAVVRQYLAAVPAERAGPVLASLAGGMQDEVARMLRESRAADARRLAADAIPIFEQLAEWVAGQASLPAAQADSVRYGLAEMKYRAGLLEEASAAVDALLERDERNGNYLWLRALVRTSMAGELAGRVEIERAREAWEALLADSSLRERHPLRYWEARFHFLSLLLREGRAEEVEKAIRADQIWSPELGGPEWQARFEALRREAAARLPQPPATAPATESP